MSEHWPPEIGDRILSYRREDEGLNPDGEITDIQGDEVIVLFLGSRIERTRGLIRINGILYPDIVEVTNPEMLYPPGESESFELDYLRRRWSRRDGGLGCWVLND